MREGQTVAFTVDVVSALGRRFGAGLVEKLLSVAKARSTPGADSDFGVSFLDFLRAEHDTSHDEEGEKVYYHEVLEVFDEDFIIHLESLFEDLVGRRRLTPGGFLSVLGN